MFLVLVCKKWVNKKNHELMLAISRSARVSVFGKENVPSQTCFFEEKKLPLVGWNKNSGRVDNSPLGIKNVRVSLL